jgi:hypothetical protein
MQEVGFSAHLSEAVQEIERVLKPGNDCAQHVIARMPRGDAARAAAGWQPWLDTVTGWLREGRSPAVFIHTPGNVEALGLARRFHDEVRARVPEAGPLPEPVPVGPPTLF